MCTSVCLFVFFFNHVECIYLCVCLCVCLCVLLLATRHSATSIVSFPRAPGRRMANFPLPHHTCAFVSGGGDGGGVGGDYLLLPATVRRNSVQVACCSSQRQLPAFESMAFLLPYPLHKIIGW